MFTPGWEMCRQPREDRVKWAPSSSSASCSEAVIPCRRLQPGRLRGQPSNRQPRNRVPRNRVPRQQQVLSVAQEWEAWWQAPGPSSLACGACFLKPSRNSVQYSNGDWRERGGKIIGTDCLEFSDPLHPIITHVGYRRSAPTWTGLTVRG
jgi:hypothetical protein